tara:strand:+ start:16460 stop:16573 length:114 start_codon:yes stop_codon:yes gene_type:complete
MGGVVSLIEGERAGWEGLGWWERRGEIGVQEEWGIAH